MSRTLPLLVLLSACATAAKHPVVPAAVPPPSGDGWQAVLDGTPIDHEAVVSARWAVPRKGLIDLSDPKAAELPDDEMPIVLPVHVLTHPDHGVFVVDTGVSRDRAAGGHGGVRGLVRGFAGSIEAVEPLMDIVARQDGPLSGVLLTHAHLDHVLGLVDVPAGTPIYTGVGELAHTDPLATLMRPTYNALFDGHDAVRELGGEGLVDLGPVKAVDLLGDGSIWAIPSPGHTPGSLAWLVRTDEGPVLFAGDTSHTLWGWEHDVTPGTYTADHEANAESLAALRALVVAHPEITVYVGHEEGPVEGLVVEDAVSGL